MTPIPAAVSVSRCHQFRPGAFVRMVLVAVLLSNVAPGWAASTAEPGTAASDAEVLLHLFQEKGLISPQDVEKARAELARRAAAAAAPPESKFRVANWIKGIELYGDARLRYEYRDGENLAGDRLERQRWRYRFRFGTRMQFTDHFQAGLRLETGPSGRSSNVTFGDDAGVWGKGSDGLHVGLLYLNWRPAEWFGATAGRQEIPFRTTSLVWDGDLTPEGLSQTFKTTTGNFDLFATLGQFVYDDANPDKPLGGGRVTDAYLLGQQLGARYKFNPELSLQLAPALYVYSGGGDTYNSTFVGTTAPNSVGINDLLMLSVPFEVRWQPGSLPVRFFADFALNLKGADRAAAAGFPDEDDEIYAYQVGVELGSARKRGGWMVRGFWQRSGLFALDPNLVDSDLFDSRLNMQGVAAQGAYGLTDFLTFTVSYANADQANRTLPTLSIGDLAPTNPLRHYQLWQVDLSYRF
jgi:hypothetical protein